MFQDFKKVEEIDLITKMGQLLNDPSYQENAKRLSRKLRDEPFKPEDRFVRLIEFAARHHGDELELYSTELGFIVYNHLDIYLPLIAVFIILVYVLFKLARILIRSVKQKEKIF